MSRTLDLTTVRLVLHFVFDFDFLFPLFSLPQSLNFVERETSHKFKLKNPIRFLSLSSCIFLICSCGGQFHTWCWWWKQISLNNMFNQSLDPKKHQRKDRGRWDWVLYGICGVGYHKIELIYVMVWTYGYGLSRSPRKIENWKEEL